MVKHMTITEDIIGTDLEAFGAWLREPEVYANFHKAFNDNDRIQLTPWTLEGRAYNREVVAYLPVNAPHWFRKAIGTDVIRVKEFQSATFEHGTGSAAQVYRADAHPRDVTAVLFTTQLCFFPPSKDVIPFLSVQLKYTDGPPGSNTVKVDASLSCTAEGLHWLWVLHSAIEKIMLKQARDNIVALISFFQKEVSSGALTEHPPQRQATAPPEAKAVQHHLADVAGAFNAQEHQHTVPHPRDHSLAHPESPRSVYFDAEEDAFSVDDVLSIREVKQRRRSGMRRWLCCFGICCKSDSDAGGQAPSQVHLLD